MKNEPTIDELRKRRLDLMNLFNYAETEYVRQILKVNLRRVQDTLYTKTKKDIYL